MFGFLLEVVLLFVIITSVTKFQLGTINPVRVVLFCIFAMVAEGAVQVFAEPSIGLWSLPLYYGSLYLLAIWLFYLTPIEAVKVFALLAAVEVAIFLVSGLIRAAA